MLCVSTAVEVSGQACLYSLVYEAAGSVGVGGGGEGSGLGERVLCWLDFGRGVNKSGEEASVTYRPADNISGSTVLPAKPDSFSDTHV